MTTPLTHEDPATRVLRRVRLSSADVVAVGGVAAVGLSFLLSPDHVEAGPVLCPFRALTGLPCPGCGLTRSWVYASHGWWRESFAAHPFGIVVMAAILAFAAAVVVRRIRHAAPPQVDRVLRHPLVLGFSAVWITFAVIRLVQAI